MEPVEKPATTIVPVDNYEFDSRSHESSYSTSHDHDILHAFSLDLRPTDHDLDIKMHETSMKDIYKQDSEKITSGELIKIPSYTCTKSVDVEYSESDDYHLKTNHVDNDNIHKRCDTIRKNIASNYIKFKWRKMLRNRLFCSRILTLILTILLLFVSCIYCIGQTCRTELDLITSCETPKTRQEIWAHSGEISLRSAHPGAITAETYYGYTNESCWTTKKSEINQHNLWYSNKYTYQWVKHPFNIKTVSFALISLYCVLIILYTVTATWADVMCIYHNTLHKRSHLYEANAFVSSTGSNIVNTTKGESIWLNYFKKVKAWYKRHAAADTSAWIIMMFINEFIEIMLQTQALLLYNGYHLFDPNHERDVYLANKPMFIVAFAAILAFNCFGSGLCWLCYALLPNKCRGLMFKLTLFYVDEISDLLYTMFPFVIIFWDDYNQKPDNIWTLVAQLNISSSLPFFATLVPLFFLCNKCLFISINSIHKMRNQYYSHWQFIQSLSSQCDSKLLAYEAQLRGFKTQTSFRIGLNQKEIYDSKGNIQINVKLDVQQSKKQPHASNVKVAGLMFASSVYIITGILTLFYTTAHINEAQQYCSQIDETRYFSNGTFKYNTTMSAIEGELFRQNPELFLWSHCLYQVYPFTANSAHKCQCRVFVIEWRSNHLYSTLRSTAEQRHKYFNITQSDLLRGIMQNWYMLEKFSTQGSEGDISSISDNLHQFGGNMYNMRKMKAFSWSFIVVEAMEEGISSWSDLEYFHIEHTNSIRSLPSDFAQLHSLKYFRSTKGGLVDFPLQICELRKLKVLQIEWEPISIIPHCIGTNLKYLETVLVNGCIGVNSFPLSLLSLPNLQELSLWHAAITFDAIVSYNNISDTAYFDTHFTYNQDAEYYLSLNPICSSSALPTQLQLFLDASASCDYPCEYNTLQLFCPPHLIGDGKCDFECNYESCLLDYGDCHQLCFVEEFSNCTWELLTNDACDEECNNDYCRRDNWLELEGGVTGLADMNKCVSNSDLQSNLLYCGTDASSDHNIYTDFKCNNISWVGDGLCDDACRTDACLDDLEDCEKGCMDDICSVMFSLWTVATQLGANDGYLGEKKALCTLWPLIQSGFGVSDAFNCSAMATSADINHDGYLNFREFVIGILSYFHDLGDVAYSSYSSYERRMQVNCSACNGVEHYNAVHI